MSRIVRTVTPDDAERLLEIYGYYVEKTAISFEYDVPSIAEFRNRIENILLTHPYLVLEEDGVIQGYAYARAFYGREAYRYSCEMSIYLDRSSRGRGYGRLLYEALEAELRKMGFLNVYACIADPVEEDEYLDRNSEHFHEAMGYKTIAKFQKCGSKFGRWYNLLDMEKIIGEHCCPPKEFIPFCDLKN